MAISALIVRGYGSFGSATEVVTRGYGIASVGGTVWSGVVGIAQDRVTETSASRLVETGEQRETGSISNDVSVMTAAGSVTGFDPIEVRNNGVWEEPAVSVNHSGTWKTPLKGYVNDSGTWKRIH